MMPSVPSSADEEAREVVARRRLARPAAGARRSGRRRSPRSGPARSRASCRSAPRSCPTRASRPCRRSSRWRPGRSGRTSPVPLSSAFELLARDARLHAAVEIVGVDLEHPVHLRQVDADAAVERRDVALERGTDAERDHRHARRGAQRGRSPRPPRCCADTRRCRAAPRRRVPRHAHAARGSPRWSRHDRRRRDEPANDVDDACGAGAVA